jgi:hypothetical protein
MEYVRLFVPPPGMFYLVHCFQICSQVGVTPPMLGAHIIEAQFLAK